MKKIGVLTYPVKHRKTFDLISILKANGYKDVIVYAIPFHYQKKTFPIYQHRPEMNYNVPPTEQLCSNLSYQYKQGQLADFQIETDRIILIAGAGIIPEEFVKTHTLINAHPGYIPNCRGLDAVKWAIVENQPIGVTSHLIGDYVDAGQVIERRLIPVYKTDTFHALAQRVYENEVSMLVEAVEKYQTDNLIMMHPDGFVLHKRMPANIEQHLMERFDEYKNTNGIERTL